MKAPLIGFFVGAGIPLFWGILSFLLFNGPEDWFSRLYWDAVYLTCPFWAISGYKGLWLTPLLNGCLYATLFLIFTDLRTPKKTG